jgi:hypothetical protein
LPSRFHFTTAERAQSNGRPWHPQPRYTGARGRATPSTPPTAATILPLFPPSADEQVWVARPRERSVHIGVVLAGAAAVCMLFTTVQWADDRSWRSLIFCLSTALIIIGGQAAMLAYYRRRIVVEKSRDRAAIIQTGFDLDNLVKVVQNEFVPALRGLDAISIGRLAAAVQQVSARMERTEHEVTDLRTELLRLRGTPDPEGAAGGGRPGSVAAMQADVTALAKEVSALAQTLESLESVVEKVSNGSWWAGYGQCARDLNSDDKVVQFPPAPRSRPAT